MIRHTALFVCMIGLLFSSSCSLLLNDNHNDQPWQFEIVFTVNDGASSTTHTWPAKYQNVGFSYDTLNGYHYGIFCATDRSTGEIYTYKHVYARLEGSAEGTYTNADGVTELVYHDSLGYCYDVDPLDTNTWISIEVEDLGNDLFYGHFEGVLVCPSGYFGEEYITISGRIYSYFD